MDRNPEATSPNSSSPIPLISRSSPKPSGTGVPLRSDAASCGRSLSATRVTSSRNAVSDPEIDLETTIMAPTISNAATINARSPIERLPEFDVVSRTSSAIRTSSGPSPISASLARSERFCSMKFPDSNTVVPGSIGSHRTHLSLSGYWLPGI